MAIAEQVDTAAAKLEAPGAGRREWMFAALAIVLGLALVLGSVELFVRLFVDDGLQFDLEMWKYARDIKIVSADPLIGHQHAPNRAAHLMGVDVTTNSHGLRDYEYNYERVPGMLRVVMLGDSLTLGWGVPFADIFSKRVERQFAQDGTAAEVINTGVGNWNTINEVEYFLTEAYKYQPDIVVLNFFVNDAEPVLPHKAPGFLMQHCYSCVFLAGRIDTLLRQVSRRKDWGDYYLGLFDHGKAPGWIDAKSYLRKLADYCRSHKIKLLIASLPELHDVRHYQFQEITDLVKQAGAEDGAAFVDLLDAVKDQDSSKLWVTPPDPHPNAFANKFFSDALYQKLRTLE